MKHTIENSTQENDLGNGENLEVQKLYDIMRLLWTVFSPIILLLGTFGNCMILIVLRHIEGAAQSMSVFFGALAVSDLLLMYTGLLRQWLLYVLSIDVRDLHSVICKLHIFFVYFLTMTSSWFLVCMTMQRVMSVVWPHRVQFTKRKAKVTAVIVVVLLTALNAHLIVLNDVQFSTEMGAASCYDQPHLEQLAYYGKFVYPWVDLIFSSAIPSLILFVGNTVLVAKVTRATRRAQHLTDGQGAEVSQARVKVASSLTVTLMSVSAAFLILTLPMCIYLIVDHYTVQYVDERGLAELQLGFTMTSLLWYSNTAVNFYVYCLTGTKFRKECRRLLLGCCRKAGRTNRLGAAANGIFSVTQADHRYAPSCRRESEQGPVTLVNSIQIGDGYTSNENQGAQYRCTLTGLT